jgi:recombinational DNA repair protein (RecF pathway)
LLGALGFTPALDACVRCDAELNTAADVAFSADAGGVLCARCGAMAPSRNLPTSARARIRVWLADELAEPDAMDEPTSRAHRRLLRMFVHAHLTDGRPLRAFDAWATA